MSKLRRLLIAVAESDRTFERLTVRGREVWAGRCIHCKRRLTVPLDPDEPASATLEHIVPRTHGGGDDLANLALACATCNHQKGTRLDCRQRNDPSLEKVIHALRQERMSRMRAS